MSAKFVLRQKDADIFLDVHTFHVA